MLKKIGIAAAALAFAAPALADGWHGHSAPRGHNQRFERFERHERFEYRPRFVQYRPVYYAAPRVVYAPPAYYYPPNVSIGGALAPGVSFRLDLPL